MAALSCCQLLSAAAVYHAKAKAPEDAQIFMHSKVSSLLMSSLLVWMLQCLMTCAWHAGRAAAI